MMLAACASLLSACGTQGTVNQELLNQNIAPNESRIVVTRDKSLLYFAGPADVSVDGKYLAGLARGGAALTDVPAGTHKISVHAPTTFGTYDYVFKAAAGRTYKFVVSPNDGKSAGPGILLGVIGDAIDNTGYYKIEQVR